MVEQIKDHHLHKLYHGEIFKLFRFRYLTWLILNLSYHVLNKQWRQLGRGYHLVVCWCCWMKEVIRCSIDILLLRWNWTSLRWPSLIICLVYIWRYFCWLCHCIRHIYTCDFWLRLRFFAFTFAASHRCVQRTYAVLLSYRNLEINLDLIKACILNLRLTDWQLKFINR